MGKPTHVRSNLEGLLSEESHVGYVTNGVHFPTWTATEWRKVYAKYFDKNYIYDQSNESLWHAIYNVPDAEIWETRMALKKKLVNYIREKFAATWLKNQGDPSRVVALLDSITPNALTSASAVALLHTSVLTSSSPIWNVFLRS